MLIPIGDNREKGKVRMKKWNIGWGPISQCNMNCEFCYRKENRNECEDLDFSD
jgi:MoaA/NifB/PqqE/SkfB family radical SAM enzyme